jgi:hypothetical protein
VLWRLTQIVAVCLLSGQLPTYAQQPAISEMPAEVDCSRPADSEKEKASGPEISIVEVVFSGSLELPVSDQEQIAASVKQQGDGNSVDGVIDEALERVKAGWLDHGYFKVEVSADARTLTSSPARQRIALSVHVDEGIQYRLRKMTFKPSGGIIDVGILRGLFPIKDGDVFVPRSRLDWRIFVTPMESWDTSTLLPSQIPHSTTKRRWPTLA